MSAALPAEAGPLLLAALTLIALLVPPMRPHVHDPDPDECASDRDGLAEVELVLAVGIAP